MLELLIHIEQRDLEMSTRKLKIVDTKAVKLDSSKNETSPTKQKQKDALQKLAKNFAAKKKVEKPPDSWQNLIQNLLQTQRGKVPLLLAVEAGNQSMVRELLAAQTVEQLKVSILVAFIIAVELAWKRAKLANIGNFYQLLRGKSNYN